MTQDVAEGGEKMPMQCFPLYTLLLALGNPTVDFLSLDVEVCFKQIDLFSVKLHDFKGPELEVLETVPWAKVAQLLLFVINDHIPNQGGHSGYQC